jgi:hypothetical protein
MKKLLFLGVLTLMFLHGCNEETLGPVTDTGVYINELRATGGDWIEFYNNTSSTVELNGYKVYDDPASKFTITSGTIASKGFFILNCDGTGVGGNTSFKLSSAGETIYLEDKSGKLIDQITFPALASGTSYARFPDGGSNWKITGLATKNATNGSDQAPTISLVSRSPVVPGINDVVTILATVTDVSGIGSVKLFSRKGSDPFTSTNMTLSGGVFTATIAAANSAGTVEYYIEAINTRNITTVDPDNAPAKTHSYLVNTDDITSLKATLKVNEFMALNTACCADNSSGTNEFDDWIEIYNGSGSAVELNGYYLSDDSTNPFKFKIVGSTILPANGYLVIWADEQGSQGKLHANFQLSNLGEEVGLYYLDGRQIDKYTFGAQTENTSWGRTADGASTWKSWSTPTPGARNQ